MKGIVVYYSATGSTAKIAKAIHRGMSEPMECTIDFSKQPVLFRKSCLNCALCDKMCPQLAIEVDAETMGNRTQRRINKDYHPFVRLLAEAEAKGRFRRLVPLDKVGWYNPVYKNPNHPRFVIEEE